MLQVWLREHNRLCTVMETGRKTKDLPGKERFKIAKATVIAKMQVRTCLYWPIFGQPKKPLSL